MTKRHTAISRQVMSIGLTVILCVGLTPAMCGIDADNTAQVDALMGQVRSGEKPGGIGIGFAGQIIQLGSGISS